MTFRVDLDSYRGPLDLLLYLVRKHEVDLCDLPVAAITDQYMEYLELLQEMNVDEVGDFVEMASTLIEAKSKMVLPVVEEEVDDQPVEDPRDELVERLLEYKKYRDAASMLDEESRAWQQRYARMSNDLPPRKVELSDQPIQDVDLWDLVSALNRVLKANETVDSSNIVYDDTPIHVHMGRIHQQLVDTGIIAYSELFRPGMHKSTLIGVFLGVLELVRHHNVRAEQSDVYGEIVIRPGDDFDPALRLAGSDYEDVVASETADETPAQPR